MISQEHASRCARFEEILELVDFGRLEHAEARCHEMLEAHPRDVNILGLPGWSASR